MFSIISNFLTRTYTFEPSEATDFPAEDKFVEDFIKRLAEQHHQNLQDYKMHSMLLEQQIGIHGPARARCHRSWPYAAAMVVEMFTLRGDSER